MTAPRFTPWSDRLRCWLFPAQPQRRDWWGWLLASGAIALAIGWAGYRQATSGPYIVQDDARQHVFWMQRWLDPTLFPQDWIADYFQSVAPEGYRTLYRLLAWAGLNPLAVSKILPIGLGLVVAGLAFGLTTALLPIPVAGFLGSVLTSQVLAMTDDLASATPRSFLYPLFLAFAWGWIRSSLGWVLGTIGLLGLFYPQYVLVALGILAIDWCWRWRWQWPAGLRALMVSPWGPAATLTQRRDRLALGGGIAGIAVLGLYALQASDYGPVVTVSQARSLPEFFSSGRANFFDDNWFDFWILGQRSSLLPKDPFTPATLVLGLLLPVVWWQRDRWRLGQHLSDRLALLPIWLASGIGCYTLAHLLLFRLHLPGRYTQHSIRMMLPIAAALVLTLLLDQLLGAGRSRPGLTDPVISTQFTNPEAHAPFPSPDSTPTMPPASGAGRGFKRLLAVLLAIGLFSGAVLYPLSLKRFPKANYVAGESPGLYQFFATQPVDLRVASLAKEADNLPTFAGRSVLVAREYAIPYHWGYYRLFRQRMMDLLQALYSPNLAVVLAFNRQYSIDFWLLDRDTFTIDYLSAKERRANRWLRQFQPVQQEALDRLNRGEKPALRSFLAPDHPCQAYQQPDLVVLDAKCLAKVAVAASR